MRKSLPKKLAKKAVPLAVILNLVLSNPHGAFAYSDSVVSAPNGKPFFSVTFADQGDTILGEGKDDDNSISFDKGFYTFSPHYKDAIGAGLQYWANILGPQSQNTKPLQVSVGTDNAQNASAQTFKNRFKPDSLDYAAAIQNGKPLSQLDLTDYENATKEQKPWAVSVIAMGQHLGAEKKALSTVGTLMLTRYCRKMNKLLILSAQFVMKWGML